MENRRIKKVIFLANRLNKGPIGGPAGVLYLQEHILGKDFFDVPSEFYYNEKETKDLMESATALVNRCKKDIDSAYFIVHDVETGYVLAQLGADYSLVFHQQGSVMDEKISFGLRLPPAEVNKFKRIEKGAFCGARSVHFPSNGAKEMFFSSKNTIVKESMVNVGMPLYNTIVKRQKVDNDLPKECEAFLRDKPGFVFLSVGTVTYAKGQERTIEYIKRICKQTDQNIKYLVVGDGVGTAKLDATAATMRSELPNFSYLHIRKLDHDKVLTLYDRADFYIMLHNISIFDLATLEAMRGKCAVILSNVGGNIDFNKENNILFPEEIEVKKILNADVIKEYQDLNQHVFDAYFSEDQYKESYRKLWGTLTKDVPNIKVMVCYHKKYKTLSNNVYKPIVVGNALKDENIIPGALKDDDGINISAKNPFFCELTAHYWAWKNHEKLGRPDYIGLMHYRRYLWFGQKIDKIEDYVDERQIQRACINNVDIILPTPTDIFSRTQKKLCVNFAEQYSIEQHSEDLDTVRKIIEDNYPQYYQAFIDTTYTLKKISWCNVFVAKKAVMDEYSQFLFDVLFAAEKLIPYTSYKTIEEQRVFGFLSELLLNTYVYYKQHTNETFKVAYYDLVNIERAKKAKVKLTPRQLLNKIIKKTMYSIVPEKTIKGYIYNASAKTPPPPAINYNEIIKINNYETYRTIWYANAADKAVVDQLLILSKSSYQWTVNHSELWQMLMCMLLENGQMKEFDRVFNNYVSIHKYNGFEKFLKLSNFLYHRDPSIATYNGKIAVASGVYDKMMANAKLFDEMVGGDKTVAIVGNAGTEIGKNKGKEIDNHDVVIRFNNYPFKGYVMDYGTKTDIWVRGSGAKDVYDRASYMRYKLIMWEADYEHYKVFYDHLDIMGRMLTQPYQTSSFFSAETHNELRELSMSDFPTSGAVAIYAAYLAKGRSFKNVDIYGFSFLSDEEFTGHFYDNKSKMGVDHKMDAEKAFLRELFLSCKAKEAEEAAALAKKEREERKAAARAKKAGTSQGKSGKAPEGNATPAPQTSGKKSSATAKTTQPVKKGSKTPAPATAKNTGKSDAKKQ